MKQSRLFFILITLTVVLYTQTAGAEKAEDEFIKLEKVVVTATKTEQGIEDASASISVIDGETIDNSPNVTLDEAFRYTPSVQVIRGEGIGTVHNFINIRGVGTKRNLLYVDGVSMVESMSGNTTLSFLPTENIDKIEILRGPSSALYGGRGMGGVISIFSKRPEKGFHAEAKPSYGNYDLQNHSAGFSYGGDKLSVSMDASFMKTENYWARDDVIYRAYDYRTGEYSYDFNSDFENPDHVGWENWNRGFEETSIRPKIYYTPNEATEMILSLGFMENETHNGYTDRYTDSEGNDVKKRLEKDKTYVGLTGKTAFPEGSSVSYRLTYHEPESRIIGENMNLALPLDDPGQLAPGGRAPQFYRSESIQGSKDYEMEISWSKPLSSEMLGDHRLTVGAEYLQNDIYWSIEEVNTGTALTTPVDVTKDGYSAYLQDEYFIGKKFTLSAGLRGDFFDDFDDQFSPKLSLLFKQSPGTQYFISSGYAFNPPPYSQKFGTDWNMTAYNIRTNNADLDAEKLWSTEVGIRKKMGKRFNASLAAFYSEAKDLIESVKERRNIGGSPQVSMTYEYHDNIDRAVMQGIESELSFDLSENHRITGAMTFLDTENKDTGKRLTQTPTFMGSIAYTYNRTFHVMGMNNKVYTTLRGRGQNGVYIKEYSVDEPRKISSFFVMDLSLGWDMGKHFGLFANATNLLDKDYREFTYTRYQPGRTFLFGGVIRL